MNYPGIVTIASKNVNASDYEEFCIWLNQEIKSRAVGKNMPDDDRTYIYNDSKIKCTYVASAYGNENYYLEVSADVWNEIPEGVNPALVQDEGWNLVYAYLDGIDRQMIRQHIPGDWNKLFKQL